MADIFKDRKNEPCPACKQFPCSMDCADSLLDNEPEDLDMIVSLFKNYTPDDSLLNNEVTNQIGNHLMIIADAILQAQHQWEQKTFMNRIDEIINSYKFYSNFSQSLYEAGAFETVEDVLQFIQNPKTFDKLYNLWLELGYPKSSDAMFVHFKERVLEFKDLN